MKNKITLVLLAFSLLVPSFVSAASRVSGYTTKRGTYVQSYYRSSPNNTKLDNYSTKGNYNPYTGKSGYLKPYKW